MNSTNPHATVDILMRDRARYSAREIAQAHSVGESTIRTRWFEWISKVAPAELLKDAQGYTDLARSLFEEFAQVKQCDRKGWVADAKSRYSREWSSIGVIEGELMPESMSNALALRQTKTGMLQQSSAVELAELEAFVDQLVVTESDFSEAELAAFKTAGQRRGMLRFKIETQAEIDTYSTLKQRRMGKSNE